MMSYSVNLNHDRHKQAHILQHWRGNRGNGLKLGARNSTIDALFTASSNCPTRYLYLLCYRSYYRKDTKTMLFKLAIAIIASSQLPAAHGAGFIRRATADTNSKADKVPSNLDTEEELLGSIDMEAFLSESTAATPSAELIPEPRFSSIGNVNMAEEWNHGATAVTAANDGTIKFYAPADTKVGDTLFLFLSRTDGLLPLRIDQWSRGAECFKSFNRQDSCFRAADCVKRDGPYCLEFDEELGGGNGRDLGTVVFYRHVTEDDPGCWTVELPGKTTVWAIVTAIQGVNRDRPIFRTSGTSCDAEWESEFPSVYGKENDVLLLSQCFDDTALKRHFQPPEGTELLGFTNSVDEAGFLFGKRLEETGMSGKLITGGRGGPKCKDALVSLVVNRE